VHRFYYFPLTLSLSRKNIAKVYRNIRAVLWRRQTGA